MYNPLVSRPLPSDFHYLVNQSGKIPEDQVAALCSLVAPSASQELHTGHAQNRDEWGIAAALRKLSGLDGVGILCVTWELAEQRP